MVDFLFSKELFGVISSAIAVATCAYYLWTIEKKGVRPHIFTQIIWLLVTGILFTAQFVEGAGPGAWNMGTAFVLLFLIIIWIFRKGELNVTKLDWILFAMALTAIPLWIITQNPLWSVILLLIVDAIAMSMSLIKFYNAPWKESVAIYIVANLRHLVALSAIANYNLVTVLPPAGIIAINSSIILMLLIRRYQLKHA